MCALEFSDVYAEQWTIDNYRSVIEPIKAHPVIDHE